jgi:hypothetical protein
MKQHRAFGLLMAAVVLPFLVVGILGATKIAMWVTGTSADQQSNAFLIAALLLVLESSWRGYLPTEPWSFLASG